MSHHLAPIALFVYNRPIHTKQTIDALTKNTLAKESHLFIFSDGAKHNSNEAAVASVRKYIRKITGFKEITILEQDSNIGLADSIISGVTKVVNSHGRIIVVEDDLVTSPYFLDFMNNALQYYETHDTVMAISGYQFPISSDKLPETLFLRLIESWGWGTWKRAWDGLDRDAASVMKQFSEEDIYAFNLDGTYSFYRDLAYGCRPFSPKIWVMLWYAHVFLNNGLSLFPQKSLVKNIGWDGSGFYGGVGNFYDADLVTNPPSMFSKDIVENTMARERIKQFYKKNLLKMHLSNWINLPNRCKRLVKK